MHKKFNLTDTVKALENGEIIVYPTDTLYALGADIYNTEAVKKVFKIKKRPFSIPLPIAVADLQWIKKIALVNNTAWKLAEHFLPGPLTLVLRKRKDTKLDIVTANQNKIAIRIPNNKIALNILSHFGPLTATSANIHGKKTPHVINEIKMQFSEHRDIALYIDYGHLNSKPSTIMDLTSEKPVIIRKGVITKKNILDVI
ncbi:MAG: threonylcarbamoyl-AMP synthase [Thermoplasmata archaeon]|nr:MAG: threonylcarbamoyl-AMP synthase [Thermoplasmata archaeon]